MEVTKKKSIEEVHTYHLTPEVKYVKEFTSGKEKKRYLKYIGSELYNYELRPLYDKDLTVLEYWNPCWGEGDVSKPGYKWLDNNELPEPEDIDLSKIIFLQFPRHAFFTLDKRPIPVVKQGGYIQADLNNKFYDLKKLRDYLLTHDRVKEVSEILDIPYYNSNSNCDKYISVLVLPTEEVLQMGYEKNDRDLIFHKPYIPDSYDFLGIKQFVINTEY